MLLALKKRPVHDPYFSSVISLLHFNGLNGSTTFTDQISANNPWSSLSGSATISTVQSKFGGASGSFTGSSVLNSPNDTGIQLGTGDFTIEFWQYYNSLATYQTLMCKGYSKAGGWLIQTPTTTSGQLVFYANSTAVLTETGTTVVANTWYHIAVVRQSSSMWMYRNGVACASGTDSTNYNDSTQPAIIGAGYPGGTSYNFYFNGYMDDARITKGVCRYPGGTTFSVPTAAFPNY
jgi:hypothetical protein